MNCSQKNHIPFLKIQAYVIVIMSLIVYCPFVNSQESRQSTMGKEFIVSFLPNFHNNVNNQQRRTNDSLLVFCTGQEGTNVEFHYRNRAGLTNIAQRTIPASGICSLAVSWVNYESRGFNNSGINFTIGDNGRTIVPYVRIKADADIAAYAHNQAVTTSDATLLYPIVALGKEYMILSYPSDGKTSRNPDTDETEMTMSSTPSQAIITANESNTTVTVTTEVNLVNQFDVSGNYAREFTVTLQEGESILLQTLIDLSSLHTDISGTTIRSDKPIAVFAGHQRTQAPIYSNYADMSRDHLFEQVPPLNQWGYEFLLLPFPKDFVRFITYDAYRVIASEDNTTIYERGTKITGLRKGQVYEGRITGPMHIRADKPVLVAQIRASSRANSQSNSLTNGSGDPFMMYVPPKDLYLSRYTLCAIQGYGTEDNADEMVYGDHYISIIIPTKGLASLRLDSNIIDSTNFKIFPLNISGKTCLQYSYTTIFVKEGMHYLQSEYPFAVFSFGYGEANSYGYVGGVGTGKISPPPLPLLISNDTVICENSSAQLTARGGGSTYTWFPDSNISCTSCPNPIVSPRRSMTYYVTTTDTNQCTYIDSVNVIVSRVDALLSPDTTICLGSSARLWAIGGSSYEWIPNPTLSCLSCSSPIAQPIKDTTKYYVRIFNEQSCSKLDSIIVYAVPTKVRILGKNEICLGDSLQFSAEGAAEYEWFTKDSTLCKNCPSIVVHPKNSLRLYVKGSLRTECYGIDSMDIIVRTVQVQTINDTTICLGNTLQLKTQTEGTSFQWSPSLYLDCDTCQSPNALPLSPIQYIVKVTNGICHGYDTVNINTATISVEVSAEDTIICEGSSTNISAQTTRDVHYFWSPVEGLDCDTCRSVNAKPISTTTYICKVLSQESCTAYDTVTVYVRRCENKREIIFPDLLTCDSTTRNITITNDNPRQKKRVLSIKSSDDKDSVFQLLSPRGSVIEQDYGSETELIFLFAPKENKYYEKFYYLTSDDNETIEIRLEANGLQAKIYIPHKDTTDITPGSTINVPVYFTSSQWETIPSTQYHVQINYDKKYFLFQDSIINTSTLPLIYSQPQITRTDKNTTIRFTITAPTPFTEDLTACVVPFIQLLHDKRYSILHVLVTSDRPLCIFGDTMSYTTSIFSCFTDGRLISTGSIPYAFTYKKTGDNYQIYCDIGLPAMTKIDCFTVTGELYTTLLHDFTPEGSISLSIPKSLFTNGLYFLHIQSGIFTQTLPLYIQE